MMNLRTRSRGCGPALSVTVLIAGTVFLLGPMLTGRALLSDSDILLYYLPVKTAIRNMFLHGQGLMWNPFLGEGQPLAANPEHEIFYPFTWLIFLLPVARALAVTLIAHTAVAWFGMRRLLRRLRCSQVASIVATASWTFGGLLVSSMHFLPIFYAWAWIPWLLGEIAETNPSITRLALFGGLIGLVGEPVSCAMAALLAASALFLRRAEPRRLKAVALGGVLSVVLSAASWLPGLVVAGKSVRAAGLSREVAGQLSFPPTRLVELVIPRATGNTVPHRDAAYFGWRLYPEKRWPFYTGIYTGALLVPLVVMALFERSRRVAVFLPALALSFVLALGNRGGLWDALRRVFPPWRGIRYPEKFLAVTLFTAAVIMAFGIDFVRRSRRRSLAIGAGMLAIGAAIGASAIFRPTWLAKSFPVEGAGGLYPAALARSGVTFVVMGILLALVRIGKPRRSTAVVALLVVSAVDVLASSRDFVRFHSIAEMTAPPPVVRKIVRGGVSRVVDLLPDNPPVVVPGAEVFNGPWDRNRLTGEQAIQWGVPLALDVDFDMTYFTGSDRARGLMSRVAAESTPRFARLLAGRSAGALLIWNHPITLADPVTVAAVPNMRPEIDAVSDVISFKGDANFLEKVRRYPGDLSRAAFVEGAVSLPGTGAAAITPRKMKNSSVEFTADCESACFVRIARTNDGNWRALLDGKKWPVETVDLSLAGMRIPGGHHEITLFYRDYWLMAGMVLSVAGLILLLMVGVNQRRHRPLPVAAAP